MFLDEFFCNLDKSVPDPRECILCETCSYSFRKNSVLTLSVPLYGILLETSCSCL